MDSIDAHGVDLGTVSVSGRLEQIMPGDGIDSKEAPRA